MKRILLLAAAAVLASCSFLGLSYQVGNGVSVDTPIDVDEFDTLSLPSSIDVIYSQSTGEQSIVLTCDENLVEFFNIRVEDGILIVDTKPRTSISTKTKTYVTVTSPTLSGIRLSGSGDCDITGPVTTVGDFCFKVSGSGDIETNGMVSCKNFSASVSGSGDIEVAGVLAETADFKDSGSGDISVNSLTAEDISVKMTGSGDIDLKCVDSGYIQANLSGSGDLNLSGTALSLQGNETGSGRVRSTNLTIIRQ